MDDDIKEDSKDVPDDGKDVSEKNSVIDKICMDFDSEQSSIQAELDSCRDNIKYFEDRIRALQVRKQEKKDDARILKKLKL